MKKELLKIWDKCDDFVLEAGRVILIGAYGAFLPFILSKLELLKQGDAVVVASILIVLLKAFDRWLHNKEIVKTGITGF